MHDKTIKDKIVDKLGGTGAVATICGITAGAVSQWGNYIPPRHVGKLIAAAKLHNIEISSDEFFDMPIKPKKNGHG